MQTIKRNIQPPKDESKKWELYHRIGRLAKELNHMPDAQEVKKSKPGRVPPIMVEMIF